jgi:hypothetical protein
MKMAGWLRWEYCDTDTSAKLNELGLDGWELVGVTAVDGKERFYLKRPLPSLREQITLDQRNQVLAGSEGEMQR